MWISRLLTAQRECGHEHCQLYRGPETGFVTDQKIKEEVDEAPNHEIHTTTVGMAKPPDLRAGGAVVLRSFRASPNRRNPAADWRYRRRPVRGSLPPRPVLDWLRTSDRR